MRGPEFVTDWSEDQWSWRSPNLWLVSGVLGELGSLENCDLNPEFGQHLVWREVREDFEGTMSSSPCLLCHGDHPP